MQNTDSDDLCLPALYMGDFLKQSKDSADEAVTLLDCCSGKVDHLNLKHVVRDSVFYNGHLFAMASALSHLTLLKIFCQGRQIYMATLVLTFL